MQNDLANYRVYNCTWLYSGIQIQAGATECNQE